MINRVIIIGDSHIVPLKRSFKSLNLDNSSNYFFLPFKYIKATMPGFIVNNEIIYKKVLDKKAASFYNGAGLSVSDDGNKIHSVPLKNSKVYLVGMGLGVDAFLRNFSQIGTLNCEKCVNFPLYASQAKDYLQVTCLTDFAVYQDELIDHLMSNSVQKSKSFRVYQNFIDSGFSSVELLPLPFVSLASLKYYSRSDLTLLPSDLYLYTIKKWLDCISLNSVITNPFKLISEKHLSQAVLLADTEIYSSKPSDIHMSIESCEKTIDYIHSSLSL